MLTVGVETMLTLKRIFILLAITATGCDQTNRAEIEAPTSTNSQDEAAVRSLLNYGFETTWNGHDPAAAVTRDKCIDDAVFINTSGGWIKGRERFAEMISRLHARGGPFHDHTRRHAVEELRFIRRDVAFAVVKTFDIRRAGAPTTGEETRGLIILSKEDGRWKVNALENTLIEATPVGRR